MLTLAVEDQVSEAVTRKIIRHIYGDEFSSQTIMGHGYGGLKKRMPAFRSIARNYPVWLLTDLDRTACPSVLLANWTGDVGLPKTFCFRVAVREIESWLLADREAISSFLGISAARISKDPESINDPKEYLVNLARRATKRNVRYDLVPKKGTTASQGFGYNSSLCGFVNDKWSPQRASDSSRSLAKAITRISELIEAS